MFSQKKEDEHESSDDVLGRVPLGVDSSRAWRGVLRPGESLFLPGDDDDDEANDDAMRYEK